MKDRIYPSYTVAIRTLGTAGEKYLETLRSCERQIVRPASINVYIPHGYALPKETIGKEQYIRCDKGMVTQRSLSFEEIETEYILFLDDDLSFQEDFVKKLFDGLLDNDGDCISPDIYPNHEEKFLYKIRNYFGGTKPHFKKDWAFIIRKDGHYSYNYNPHYPVLRTQSGAGACSLCKKTVYNTIHFEDERWLEKVSYALGDDQLFFYKMHLYGYKVLTAYNAKLVHLDAGTGHEKNYDKLAYASAFCRQVIWKRTIYDVQKTSLGRLQCRLTLLYTNVLMFPLNVSVYFKHKSFGQLSYKRKGKADAELYLASKDYLAIPPFMSHKTK